MPSATDEESSEQPWYAALPEDGPAPSLRWTSDAFKTELRAGVVDALAGLGTFLARAESWLRVTATLTEDELAEFGDAAAYWLGALGTEPALT